ncbi:MAG: 4-hydroxy-tetrahydrodipicolinate reductase [Rubrobacter sp.]|nr:4-hydroxy-tetrahydrodipicolinate reductase [Rubrobacter sp.]
MIRVTVVGAAGRMGREVCRAALEDPEVELAGGVLEPGSPALGSDLGELCGLGRKVGVAASEEPPEDAGVLVEFTTPEATVEHLSYGRPAVIGTTGLSGEQLARVEEAARSVPIVLAPNMSVGVNLLLEAVRRLSAELAGYDIEIVEAHHRGKRDAPSGTALLLGRAAASGRGQRLEDVAVYGREGISPRREGEIGIHALRGGAVVGEHRVILYGQGEEVEVVHRALSRRTFAEGALRAARFVAAAEPGLYTMQDVLSGTG